MQSLLFSFLFALTIAVVAAKFTIKSQDELFFYTDERVRNRQASKSYCGNFGGQLMSIESPAEAEFVRKFTTPLSTECLWLGGKFKNNTWKWCDGSNSKFLDITNNWNNGDKKCTGDCCSVCLDSRAKLRPLPCDSEQRHVCQLNLTCAETRDKILANWNEFTLNDQSFLSVMFVTRNLQITSHLKSTLSHDHEDNNQQLTSRANDVVAPEAAAAAEAEAPATTAAPVENPAHHVHHDAATARLDTSDSRVNAIANEVTQVKQDISSLKEEISKLRDEVARDSKAFKAFLLKEKKVVETRRDTLSAHLSTLDPNEQGDEPAAPVAPAAPVVTDVVTAAATEAPATTAAPVVTTAQPAATTVIAATEAATTPAVTTAAPVADTTTIAAATSAPQVVTEAATTPAATTAAVAAAAVPVTEPVQSSSPAAEADTTASPAAPVTEAASPTTSLPDQITELTATTAANVVTTDAATTVSSVPVVTAASVDSNSTAAPASS
jgi:hypothetical protein